MRELVSEKHHICQGKLVTWKFILVLLLAGTLGFNLNPASAQEYGLGFWGADTVKDKRTRLDLKPENYFAFHDEFEVTFEMQLRPYTKLPFGYVARIIDLDGRNIDIIYNGPESLSLQVVYGQELTSVFIPNAIPARNEDWIRIRLKIDLKEQTLHFRTGDTSFIDTEILFDGRTRILFGAIDFVPFKSSDAPVMNIRDIKIFEKGKLKHHFPLDESSGNSVHDQMTRLAGTVQNPIWIKSPYINWQKIHETKLGGFAAINYDPKDEKVYMVGEEQVEVYSIPDNQSTSYKASLSGLDRGSQVIYDTIREVLICYNLRLRTVHELNLESGRWNRISVGDSTETSLWFHNKYYSATDSSIYIFGGYGQHRYYNNVQQYDFRTRQWEDTLQTKGDVFHPRTHAALGEYCDTLYILGGFGSISGDQALNPQHYTDLLAFSIKDRRFTKKYDFEAALEGIDFAHSMVFVENDRSYYVLASTIFEYESHLQLLKGSLDNTLLIPHANEIPYLYHNENAYSDLFFSESQKKFIAVTFLANPGLIETDIQIHTLSFPPHSVEVAEVIPPDNKPLKIMLIIALSLIGAILILTVLWRYTKGNKAIEEDQVPPISIPGEPGNKRLNSILFFGGFQVISKDGNNITSKFTPLLKELFLVIFLNSVQDKGISLQRLTEIFWYAMDEKSAKNNRAVNIAKLKNLLTELDGCNLSRKTGYWQIVFDDSLLYSDYWTCMKLISQQKELNRTQLEKLLKITRMGPLLRNAEYEWLDDFKAECSNLIIDTLMKYSDPGLIDTDCEFIIRMADNILIFDTLHEEAIGIKCKALISLGKHALAKTTFTKFTSEYQKLYDEPYKKGFNELIKSS